MGQRKCQRAHGQAMKQSRNISLKSFCLGQPGVTNSYIITTGKWIRCESFFCNYEVLNGLEILKISFKACLERTCKYSD